MNSYGISLGSALQAMQHAVAHRLTAVQFFTAESQKFNGTTTAAEEVVDAYKSISKGIVGVSHASLMSNLASEKPNTRNFSINSLVFEMRRCEILGVEHLVVHPGSTTELDKELILATSLRALEDKMYQYRRKLIPHLCIETMVGAGGQLCSKPEHFAKMFEKLSSDNIGICMDTAHTWGAGYSPLEFWEGLKKYDLTSRVKVLHFNNTLSKKGSKKERHAELFEGVISQDELVALLKVIPEDVVIIEEQPKTANIFETVDHLKRTISCAIM